jgi:hypothetical protein
LVLVLAWHGLSGSARTPLVPLAGMLMNLAMMFSLGWENWLRLVVWLAIGFAIYFGYGRRHSVLGKHLLAEEAHGGLSPAGHLRP